MRVVCIPGVTEIIHPVDILDHRKLKKFPTTLAIKRVGYKAREQGIAIIATYSPSVDFVNTHTHTHAHTHNTHNTHTHVHTCAHAYTHTRTHKHTHNTQHTYTCTRLCTHIHTHAYTYT